MKIALIAMSGVRVANPELQALGVTLPGFVERGAVIASMPSLALLTLAALTPARHDVSYFEAAELDALPDLADFDLIAVSTYTAQAPLACELADRCRAGVESARRPRLVLGGLHATLCDRVPGEIDELTRHFDAVVVGEAEETWPALLADLESGALQRVYRAPRLADLAHSPLPRYELLDTQRYNRITVQTQRGCPHDCEFCAASMRYGAGYRQKPVELVLRDVDRVRELWTESGPPFLELADDNTFVNPRWCSELLDGLRERDVRWFTETDVSLARRPELLARLHDSGCRQVLIGFESASPAGLYGLDARGWKRAQFASYRESIRRIQESGVSVNGCFILGKDADGPEVFDEVAEFVESSGLSEVQVTVLTPFPGTPLYARLEREGRLLERRFWDRCTLFDVVFQPARMSVEELESGFLALLARLYSTEASARRKQQRRALLREFASPPQRRRHAV